MLWLKKSKKGFTLIELMVVVAIIGVLALLGLRMYSGQQEKAKNAIVKANCGTIQTLIQAELADSTTSEVYNYINTDTPSIFTDSGIHNPATGSAQTSNDSVANTAGAVYVIAYDEDDTASSTNITYFKINGNDCSTAKADVYTPALEAHK